MFAQNVGLNIPLELQRVEEDRIIGGIDTIGQTMIMHHFINGENYNDNTWNGIVGYIYSFYS